MSGPLTGYKIIDVCRALPGQLATSILADYGADVISVVQGGYYEARSEYHRSDEILLNKRNKRSIGLNLKEPKSRQVLLDLAKGSDAMVESNRPGVAKRLGIDYETMSAVNPSIVYLALSGFGQYGPYADIGDHDLSYQGVAGLVPLDTNDKPYMPAYNHSDLNAARYGALALLMGLLERGKSGKGQYIDVAFCDVTVTIPPGKLPDEMALGSHPGYNIYQTADGRYLTLSTREPWFWERLCNLIGRTDYLPHTHPEGAVRDEMFTTFRAFFKSKPLSEWMKILKDADVQFGPLNMTPEQLAADPHLKAREMVLELTSPISGKKLFEPGFAFKFSRTPASLRSGPTPWGAETVAVLEELGYSPDQIAALREAKDIG